jgi:solute:Na+ symporter, SSS family
MWDDVSWVVFLTLFAVFAAIGFSAILWRRGDLHTMSEWALAGRRLGVWLMFFLVGADLYTAYTFIAVPSSLYAKGAIYFYAVPYVAITFGIALLAMPRIWSVSHKNGYITASDLIKDRFRSRSLGIMTAATGIVAELPYIALQIVGMQAVLVAMLHGTADSGTVSEVALIVAFLVLAAFTWTSGLRGATLTAVMKDILIFITVVAVIVVVASGGDFSKAFAAKPTFATLPAKLTNAYWSLFVMSALALYLYPHAINGVQSAQTRKSLRRSTALLPLYGLGLAGLALFGVLIYGVPKALAYVQTFPASSAGTQVVPGLILYTLPDWLVGVAFLGIFIGGLVPATIMAMSQANLLTRNIIKEGWPAMPPRTETTIAKWASVAFKFIALGFVFIIPSTYAIQLQLFGGVLILQILPALFFGLFSYRLEKYALMTGLVVGIASGLYLMEYANSYSTWSTTLYHTQFGDLYIGLTALAINVVIVLVGSAIGLAVRRRAPAAASAAAPAPAGSAPPPPP